MKTFTFYKLPAALLVPLILVALFPTTIQAQTKTFTGTGNFSTAARWSGGTLPVAGDNLVIDGACTVDNNVSTNGIAYGTLTIGPATGRTLNWAVGGTNRLNVSDVGAGVASTLDMTNGGTLIIRGTWTPNNLTFTAGAGTIEVQSNITLPLAYTTYNNLIVNGAVSLGKTASIAGNLTVSSGSFDLATFKANRASAGGILTLSGTATLRIASDTSNFPANFSTHSISATSTVEYAQGNLTVATLNSAQNYGNLLISGGGTKTLAGNAGVAGNLTITSTGGSYLDLQNYTLNRTSVGGTLTVANGAGLHIGGNNTVPSNYATYALGATSNTQYYGNIQSVALLNGASYGNLWVNGIGTASLIGNVGVAGNLTCSGGTLDIGNYTINRTSAGGALFLWTTLKIGGTNTFPANYTTHDVIPSSTVEYYGSNQTIAVLNSAQNYGNLTVSGSATKTLAGNVTVVNWLTFNGATITTGADTIYATGPVFRMSTGHVVGNLKRNIVVAANWTFDIGDATNYTPVDVDFASVTTTGDLTATVAASDHANIGSCIILPSKTANRNWTLTNSGTVFTTYNATFTFVAGDLDAGAVPGNFIVGKYSAGWTYPTVGTKTATTTQATGLTAFSSFQLGVVSTLPVLYTSIKATPKNAAIQIEWQVGEESSIQKYEIERSVDGIHFSKAGEVTAKGDNSSERYQWLDVQPIAGNNYYRVRAIEADVRFFLSEIVVIKMNVNKSAVNVFPNPVKKQQINIRVDEMAKGTYTLQVYNPQGQQIIHQMVTHSGGSFNQVIHLSKTLPTGMFYLQMTNEKEKYGQAILIE